jgi:6-phosphogluconolactonase
MKSASLTFVLAALTGSALAGDAFLVYFGCYTNANTGSKGIYVSKFDSASGELAEPVLAVETASPSFLAIHPSRQYLYAVGEMGGADPKAGAVSAFRIQLPEGRLAFINQVSSVGAGPCHVALDHEARMAMIANYGGGSVASYPLRADGGLGEAASFFQHEGSSVDPRRQKGPHGHSINVAPGNRFALACDLGLDQVIIYRVDPGTGTLSAHGIGRVPAGGGPRHLAFHPNGRFVYVNNEMLMTTTVFAWDGERGALTEIETVPTLPEADRDQPGLSTAETVVHPNGRFVYVSNRGHDSIAVFACDPDSGRLSLRANVPAEGKIPRNFSLDPTGRWMIVAHQNSGTAAVFRVDPKSGLPAFTGRKIEIGGAVCVRFLALD